MIVVPIKDDTFSVINLNSTRGKPSQYIVKWIGYKWVCSCPHCLEHADDPNFVCKHVLAVALAIGKKVIVDKGAVRHANYGIRVVQEGKQPTLTGLC